MRLTTDFNLEFVKKGGGKHAEKSTHIACMRLRRKMHTKWKATAFASMNF